MDYGIGEDEVLRISTLILDLNGTLAIDGVIISGVKERILKIQELGIKVILLSGDTMGTAQNIANELQVQLIHTKNAEDKMNIALQFEKNNLAAIGNGKIDLKLFQNVGLSILTLQSEGVYTPTLLASTIIVPSIIDALDLFLKPLRLKATLRS
jgi:P-type E1-E2 ATPase